jgi:hypothetical protein
MLTNGKGKKLEVKKHVFGFARRVLASFVGGSSANLFFFKYQMRLSTAARLAIAGDKPCSSWSRSAISAGR